MALPLDRGVTLVAEAAFQHQVWEPRLEPPVAIARAGGDWRALPFGPYDPPRLAVSSLVIDTSAGYRPSLDEIVRFVQASS